jgi:hypothetical protein
MSTEMEKEFEEIGKHLEGEGQEYEGAIIGQLESDPDYAYQRPAMETLVYSYLMSLME